MINSDKLITKHDPTKIAKDLQPIKSEKARLIINSIVSTALAGIGAITGNTPMAISSSVNVFSTIVGFPMGKRLAESIVSISEGLEELEKKIADFKIENLQQNEMFVTAIMQALQIATRNHHKEKIEALRNAILNTAIGNAPDEDLQLMFLNAIDRLAPWHLRILDYFKDPTAFLLKKELKQDSVMGGASYGLTQAFPELKDQLDFYHLVVTDLISMGFLQPGSYLNTIMSQSGVYSKRTTNIGDQFLAFIKSPLIS
jgi:hypothetical protein